MTDHFTMMVAWSGTEKSYQYPPRVERQGLSRGNPVKFRVNSLFKDRLLGKKWKVKEFESGEGTMKKSTSLP